MINRNNYEVWFLDFAEGILSEAETNALYDFLDKNPDLKAEFDDFELISLKDESVEYTDKNKLKQEINIDTIKGLNDFEILAIKKIEDDITIEEERELDSILKFSPELQAEFKLFSKTKLQADETIVFTNKQNLKKSTGVVIPLWAKYISSIAAIGLLILFISRVIKTNGTTNDSSFAIDIPKQSTENIASTKSINEEINNAKIEDKKDIKRVSTESEIEENIAPVPELVAKNNITKKKSKSQLINNSHSVNPVINNNFVNSTPINQTKIVLSEVIEIPQSNTDILKFDKSKIEDIPFEINRNSIAKIKNKSTNNSVALTPKEFLIKTVKTKLEIDDKNYDKINAVEVVSASLEKSKIGSVDYKESSNKKHISINIGSFSFARSWSSNNN